MNRFTNKQQKNIEVADFGIGAMVPTTMRHVDCYVTDYNVINNEMLNEFFPGIFTREGKPRKHYKWQIVEDE